MIAGSFMGRNNGRSFFFFIDGQSYKLNEMFNAAFISSFSKEEERVLPFFPDNSALRLVLLKWAILP